QTTPIQHVVIVYQENHSFDDLLGRWCYLRRARGCDGSIYGRTSKGKIVALAHEPDIVPNIGHGGIDQVTAINNGRMDQFDEVKGCARLQCYVQYHPRFDTPTLMALINSFALSDRTFTSSPDPSFGAHLELVAATLDGFSGNNPEDFGAPEDNKPGWGCDSNKVTRWHDAVTGFQAQEPSCVPFPDGTGSFLQHSPVQHVDTIMDRLDAAGLTWKL